MKILKKTGKTHVIAHGRQFAVLCNAYILAVGNFEIVHKNKGNCSQASEDVESAAAAILNSITLKKEELLTLITVQPPQSKK